MIPPPIPGTPARGGAPREIVVHHPGGELFGSDRVMLDMASRWARADRSVRVEIAEEGPLLQELRSRDVSVSVRSKPVLRGELREPRKAVSFLGRSVRDVAAALGRRLRGTRAVGYVSTQTLPVQVLAARLAGERTVLHVHEAEVSRPGWVRAGLSLPALAAHAVIANSEFTREALLASWPRLAPRVHVVRNPLGTTTRFTPLPRERPSRLRLLYVGRLSDRKGVDLAIRTAHGLMQKGVPVALDVVGSVFRGNEEYEAGLRQLVRDLGAQDVVTFQGFVRDTGPYLQRSHAVLVPSRKEESYGNVVAEAVLAGRFVAVSDHSGLHEATEGLRAAVRVPTSTGEDWVRCVAALWAGWGTAREHLRHDREILKARHDPESMAREAFRIISGDKTTENPLLHS